MRCSLGDLAKGQSVTITLVSGVPPALAKQDEDERGDRRPRRRPTPNLTNNKDDATVTVTGAPPSKLHVRKTAEPEAVVPRRSAVVFTIVLKVPSKIDAKGVDVCDTLPAELVFVSRAGRDVQQGPRLLAPRPRQGRARRRASRSRPRWTGELRRALVKNVVVATAGNAGKVSARAPVKVKPSHGVAGRVSAVTG